MSTLGRRGPWASTLRTCAAVALLACAGVGLLLSCNSIFQVDPPQSPHMPVCAEGADTSSPPVFDYVRAHMESRTSDGGPLEPPRAPALLAAAGDHILFGGPSTLFAYHPVDSGVGPYWARPSTEFASEVFDGGRAIQGLAAEEGDMGQLPRGVVAVCSTDRCYLTRLDFQGAPRPRGASESDLLSNPALVDGHTLLLTVLDRPCAPTSDAGSFLACYSARIDLSLEPSTFRCVCPGESNGAPTGAMAAAVRALYFVPPAAPGRARDGGDDAGEVAWIAVVSQNMHYAQALAPNASEFIAPSAQAISVPLTALPTRIDRQLVAGSHHCIATLPTYDAGATEGSSRIACRYTRPKPILAVADHEGEVWAEEAPSDAARPEAALMVLDVYHRLQAAGCAVRVGRAAIHHKPVDWKLVTSRKRGRVYLWTGQELFEFPLAPRPAE